MPFYVGGHELLKAAGAWSLRLHLLIATAHYGCRVVSMPASDVTKAKMAAPVSRSFAHGEAAAIFIKLGCWLEIAKGGGGKWGQPGNCGKGE